MAGRPQQRTAALEQRASILADLEELGLVDTVLHCPEQVRRIDRDDVSATFGEEVEEACGRAVVAGRLRCMRHKASDRSVPQILANNEAIADLRTYLATRMGPKAVGSIEDVLDDEQASHADKMKAAGMVLSRIGLSEGSRIEQEVTVTVVPPRDAMAAALAGVRERLISGGLLSPSVLDVEVISDTAEKEPGV